VGLLNARKGNLQLTHSQEFTPLEKVWAVGWRQLDEVRVGSSQPPAEDSLTGFVFVGPFLLSFLASYDRIVNGQP